ncbi:long-chain fatty acid--CoA ligase [Diaphorobacter sp. HDW4A]|uniref:long-chain fatty acid--CoA ligase n=1 Tax=Diaphorobacter sp. HDW4A TaxID=2714924 RepID=UPI00140CDD40|nr:long-chain fatty acid--CoA ligase [Diaphorobacter sp. HDW4A]QIL80008.1 long-chain fatty acid--CoA ligase [Diaphorobacter sp. HDW4A]
MSQTHFQHWPLGLPRHLSTPQTSLYYNLEVSARRFSDRDAIVFYDSRISYSELKNQVDVLAGYLQQRCGVKRGDRVLLYMQNSPQFIIGYYAILRADAVVIPVNAMNKAIELAHYAKDTEATTILGAQDLYEQVREVQRSGDTDLRHVVVATYSDYLTKPTELSVPDFVSQPPIDCSPATAWRDALAAGLAPGPHLAQPDDLSVMPYTSGTTGHPKGCVHTHRTAMHTTVGSMVWGYAQTEVILAVMPMFHVTGMQSGINGPIYTASTIVVMPRWDRDTASALISRYQVSHWTCTPTMVVDMLSNPDLGRYDFSSLRLMRGGGAAMPEAIAQKLKDLCNIEFVEGYGLSETMMTSHTNPVQRPKKQCLGIPIFDTESRVIDPATLKELPPGEVGEIVTSGPQIFLEYWRNPEATKQAFLHIDGKRFFRTGDLGSTDADGYFFITDRLKRMINASGFKVWPAEVEALLYRHPDILEACIVSTPDTYRGESVKAIVVLKQGSRGKVSEDDVIRWAKENMAAYKYPRVVEFVDALPKSATGKVQWRELQEQERARKAA